MNIKTFLQQKYGVEKPTVLLAREAQILGIPYPLRGGWLAEHGEREITPDQCSLLRHYFQRKEGFFVERALKVLKDVV